uniref:Uncharacterized protein LOC104245668 n=1 Tax=Nicotiana sylvestris TaxID=4096 RepID=A0A1U7YLA8_NICSY|nr:PREDICTED: uncharacterized protein LOC104245668 [Nicotiana sylvestris]
MPFGLKNAGATYQRLVTKMFKEQLRKTMEVYINDMLVKSTKKEDHVSHLKEALEILRCHKFFNVLGKDHGLQWNEECVDTLRKLKAYLSLPPLLVKADLGERLLVYLAVSEVIVSAVLVRKNECMQSPICYISKTLIDAETRYPHLEKLALALVVASRKLRPYFQCHPIKVVTTFPLRGIVHKPELLGRLAKWAIELSQHDITNQPQTAIKSQVLSDFVVDFSAEILPEAEQEALRASTRTDLWVLYTDGALNSSGSGLGLVLEVLTGLKLALKYNARRLVLHCDSQIVVNQVTGTFQIKEQRIQRYQSEIHKLLQEFDECRLDQIPRAQNIEADGLAKLVMATRNINKENVVTLLLSAIDHIEIREQEVIAFIWKNIICLFGIPKEISCDNGPQFVGKRTIEFFEKWHIKRILSMPYHSAANGQAKSSNKVILNILKKKLEEAKGL